MAFQPTQGYTSEQAAKQRQFGNKVKSGATDYVKNEMLGVDDFGNVVKHAKEGNVVGAVKSGLTGVGELALTAASIASGFVTGGTGAAAIQGAKAGVKQGIKSGIKKSVRNTAATQATKKAETTAAKPRKFFDDQLPTKAPAKTTNTESGYPVKPKVDEKPKASVKENAKKPSKLGRAAAFGAGYALGKDDDKSSDPSKWKASAVV